MNDLYIAIAERLGEEGTPTGSIEVEKALAHRTFPDDYFYNAWDHAVSQGADLYRRVTEDHGTRTS